jgi:hypothetical protein
VSPDTPVAEIRTGRPVQQALAVAKVKSLRDLSRLSERELLALHGVGPRGVVILRDALAQAGLAFRP